MSIHRRLLWMSTLWLVVVLLLFNVFIYSFFLRESTQSQIKLIWNRAQIILSQPAIHQPAKWRNPKLLHQFLEPDSILRIITPDAVVVAQAYNNKRLLDHPIVYRTTYDTDIRNEGDVRKLYIQVPIMLKERQVGLLEIGKAMNVLSDYLGVLVTALTLTTTSTILFSIAGGYFYTRLLIRPLDRMIRTMQTIEQSGRLSRIGAKAVKDSDELARLAGTFDRMIDRLEANDAKQRQFIEDASHELRTPLTVIESYASILRRWAGEDPELRREAVEAIHSESVRLKQMVESLLDLSEERQDRGLRLQRTDVVSLIGSVAKTFSQSHGRDIRVMADEDPIWAEIDPEKIKQLFIILYDNAVKYSKSPVNTHVRREADTVRMLVADQGIGIPEHHLGRIFERFYRVHRDRSRKTGGTGLGLSIAQSIVSAHHGTIEATSENGKGTTVIVTLPVVQESVGPSPDSPINE